MASLSAALSAMASLSPPALTVPPASLASLIGILAALANIKSGLGVNLLAPNAAASLNAAIGALPISALASLNLAASATASATASAAASASASASAAQHRDRSAKPLRPRQHRHGRLAHRPTQPLRRRDGRRTMRDLRDSITPFTLGHRDLLRRLTYNARNAPSN